MLIIVKPVNSVTQKDAYPLPRVDDLFDTLAGSRLFSSAESLETKVEK